MISLKETLAGLDKQARGLLEQKQFARKCIELWQSSLLAVEDHVFPLFPAAAGKIKEDWEQVQTTLQDDVPVEVLVSTPRLLERVLYNYAIESRRSQREDLDAVKSILGLMAGAAGSVRTRTNSYGGAFQEVSEKLSQLATLEDAAELRRRLSEESKSLQENVLQMVAESEAALAAMEAEVQHFREKLAAAEEAASTDALTGLANRRELERQLDMRIQTARPFCAMLFDLDDFKSVNDRFGHACGDQLLRQFSAVLNEQVRPGDVVARWGGDEFFVIFDCELKDALRRSQQISLQVARRYELVWNGKKVQISARASSGVAEYCFGETAAELFQRADQAMYVAKQQHAKPPVD